MNIDFVCPICGNKDKKFIGYLNGKPYCRRCIEFCGENYENEFYEIKNHEAQLSYKLSEDQKKISEKIVESYKSNKNTLVYAVCGAGKTELIFSVIEYALSKNQKVGFAIPRRDVVIELHKRLSAVFKANVVTCIYGGHTNKLSGEITILTTHQLYRFEEAFDLLILDEIDAFPFKNNEVLNAIFKRSIKGKYVMMSATPSEKIIEEFKKNNDTILTLFKRYHKHPLPVPKIIIVPILFQILYIVIMLKKYRKLSKKTLIFVPTIGDSKNLFNILKFLVKRGNYVNSKSKFRNKIIDDFRNSKYDYLVTTAILERGVTLSNLQVIILNADNYQYDKAALIQISGRVGRTKEHPDGEITYIAKQKTEEMVNSIREIKRYNESL